jgi:hypothetical protein
MRWISPAYRKVMPEEHCETGLPQPMSVTANQNPPAFCGPFAERSRSPSSLSAVMRHTPSACARFRVNHSEVPSFRAIIYDDDLFWHHGYRSHNATGEGTAGDGRADRRCHGDPNRVLSTSLSICPVSARRFKTRPPSVCRSSQKPERVEISIFSARC